MSAIARYVVDAVVVERRSPTQVARECGISKRWIFELLKRFREGGYAALEPRSRQAHTFPNQVPRPVERRILRLRRELSAAGHDAGPQTIHYHLCQTSSEVPAVVTIWRILKRHGLVTPQPHKRPRSSFIRFEAKLANETWQADATPWQLADGSEIEILNILDDHSRVALASRCFRTVKGLDVVASFDSAASAFGPPASLLTDNGRIFTAKSGGGRNALEHRLQQLGVIAKHSTPYHPQTCGKVERFHQTLKRFLDRQPPAPSLGELQRQLDSFRAYYNNIRPHRALGRFTPMAAFNAGIKAKPPELPALVDHRVRRDKINSYGKVTLRYEGRLRHIPVGAKHRNRRVRLLVAGRDVRVVSEDGELLRALTLDPARDYQPMGGRWPVHNGAQHGCTMP